MSIDSNVTFARRGETFTQQKLSLIGTAFLQLVENLCSKDENDKINIISSQTKKFPLTAISKEEAMEKRLSGKPVFILLMEGRLFYADVPSRLNFYSQKALGKHLCCSENNCCSRLSPALDCDGGCHKVRDLTLDALKSSHDGINTDLLKCIDKYDFITSGFETCNTKLDSFMVLTCKNYTPCKSNPRKSKKKKDNND